MKKRLLLSSLLFLILGYGNHVFSQNIGINATGAAPNASAGLDVDFTNKGLLVPRVALTATNAAGPIAAPTTSLLVYNTATAGAAPNNVYPGYYYWNGAAWVRQVDQNIRLWVYPPTNINANTRYTLTATIPGHASYDAAMVNLAGDWAVTPGVVIEHVESRTGEVRFIVLNRTGATNYTGMDFVITTIKP